MGSEMCIRDRLAGSTIMLLTVPWGLSIWFGRVAVVDGVAQYRTKRTRGAPPPRPVDVVQAKLEGAQSVLRDTGVAPYATIRDNSYIMALTGLAYLIIQGPAMQFARDASKNPPRDHYISRQEHWCVLLRACGYSSAACKAPQVRFPPIPA